MRNILKPLFDFFGLGEQTAQTPQPAENFDDELVIFAGADTDPISNDSFEFSFYIVVGQGNAMAVTLPGEATDPNVIADLQKMQPGQTFRITGEQSVGTMGTLVTAIEVDDSMPAYDISSWESPVINLTL